MMGTVQERNAGNLVGGRCGLGTHDGRQAHRYSISWCPLCKNDGRIDLVFFVSRQNVKIVWHRVTSVGCHVFVPF